MKCPARSRSSLSPEDVPGQKHRIGAVRDDEVQRAALVALLQRPGARWSDITDDILDSGSALDVLHDTVGGTDALFPAEDIDALLASAAEQISAWVDEGIGFRTFLDDDYPPQLRDIREMPPVLFERGAAAPDDRAIAVVGTRQPSERGLKIATKVAETLAEHKVTVVSGLAAGIDSAAHRAALDAGGRTVAVIGTGIRRYYPRTNVALQDEIADRGLVVSHDARRLA